MSTGRVRIFAYGSNMHPGRMEQRVRTAAARGRARLPGHRLACDKPGRDGSAKANVLPHPEEEVWGVLWEIDRLELATLDGFEGGYERTTLTVWHEEDGEVDVEVYVSERRCADPVPFDWYKTYLVEGARAHGLPGDWVARLLALPSRPGAEE